MPAERDWVLLANHADKTFLRTSLAFCLGELLGMGFTPGSRHVELTLNGEYLGLYQLTDQVQVSPNRVNVAVDAGSPEADVGFLLEIDDRLDEDHWFVSDLGVPITFKFDTSEAQRAFLIDHVRRFEAALQGPDSRNPERGWQAFLDAKSLIDLYLVNELVMNKDGFFSSTYLHKNPGERLRYGLLWDFDLSAGNVEADPQGWWIRRSSGDTIHNAHLLRLLEDPDFEAHLAGRWQFLHARLPQVQEFLARGAETLDEAQRRNFGRWDVLGTPIHPSRIARGSYEAEVGALLDWLARRADWIDGNIDQGR